MKKTATEFRFGNCRVDLDRREILQGGAPIKIEPKAFDLLVFLIRNRERVVDKLELQDVIWAGTIVTEGALTRCIMKVRRAIDDGTQQQTLIKTVHGHGYRFVGDLLENEPDNSPARALTLPDKPSVAVLPFLNLSQDPAQEYFSDGITDDIITELSRFKSLFVIARHSSFCFKGQAQKIQHIANELGVAYIVDGSVQRSAQRLRINARLVNVTNGAQLWAERYERDIGDIFVVQDEVAGTIAATIGGRVEASRGRQRIDSAGLEAYDLVLRAQLLYYKISKQTNAEARGLLEKAIDRDPGNARAHALLAAVHSMDSWSFWSEDNTRSSQLALEYGQESIELDDSDSLAHALFAEILFDCGKPELSEAHFRRAISLNSNDIAAHALYASILAAAGRVDEALQQIELAERLDPFGLYWIPWIKGTVMLTARRYEEAIAAYELLDDLQNQARLELVAAYAHAGRIPEAHELLQEFFAHAREEMPDYPGERLEHWRPFLQRMVDYKNEEDMDHFIEALIKAGMNP